MTTPPPEAPRRRRRRGSGLIGALRIIGGTIALLEALGLWHVRGDVIGPVAAITIGAWILLRERD